MSSDRPHHKDKSTYILTQSLGERMAALADIGITVPKPTSTLFTDIQAELVRLISDYLPDVTVRTIGMSDLASSILAKARGEVGNNAMIVSTCLEIASPTKGATIQINRIIDEDGEIMGLGPRPGQPSLDDQVAAIVQQAAGRSIVVVEDGSFTGKTLRHVIECFEKKHVKIETVVLGFAFPKAIETLNGLVNGGVHCVEVTDTADLVDWMPDHDFIPFAPNCGRTFGVKIGGSAQPYYSANGYSYAAPYIEPFGRPSDWANIPRAHSADFSLKCLELAKDMFRAIGKLNGGGEIRVGDLTKCWSRVSIPYTLGQRSFPDVSTMGVNQLIMEYWNAVTA